MIHPELLKTLCCPETRQGLSYADSATLEKLNRQIVEGRLVNRRGNPVQGKIDAGLIRADKKLLYPVRGNLPILLIDEAIPL